MLVRVEDENLENDVKNFGAEQMLERSGHISAPDIFGTLTNQKQCLNVLAVIYGTVNYRNIFGSILIVLFYAVSC